jgi:hypothetical protein
MTVAEQYELAEAQSILASVRWELRRREYWRNEYRWWHTFTLRSLWYRRPLYWVSPPPVLVEWAESVVKKYHPHLKSLPTKERG